MFDLSFDSSHWLESFVISQIFTDKKTDEIPSGWWAEELEDFQVGSELHRLKRAKLTPENIELAIQSVTNSLSVVKEKTHVSDFHVLAERRPGALLLQIGITPIKDPQAIDYVFHVPIT